MARSWIHPCALIVFFAVPAYTAAGANPFREQRSLNGAWSFRRDALAPASWVNVTVPSSFQSHEGDAFHGIGWYKKTVAPVPVAENRRILVRFEGAATLAEVWWNDAKVGSHLGAWTPFRCDVTDESCRAGPGRPHELRVRLDEKVGHDTQGFLPVIAPHFGGLWQDVHLEIVPETYLDDLRLLAVGDLDKRCIRVEVPVLGGHIKDIARMELRYRPRGTNQWTVQAFHPEPRDAVVRDSSQPVLRKQTDLGTAGTRAAAALRNDLLQAVVPVANIRPWSPEHPDLYDIEVLIGPAHGGWTDQITATVAFRKIEARGGELLLNGKPLQVRGILNWGYYPPRVAPALEKETYLRDFQFARALGFNLMKFCLWVPPRRCLELADEMGILVWMEYPTWHANLTVAHAPTLTAEFTEFLAYDRNHPAVILRSLTCESGRDVDQPVLQQLYNLAHRMIPGSVIEDNSSWIAWNRICDFYDDHPYGNNHTWVATLTGLRKYVKQHGVKPLLLGEAIAADTWAAPDAVPAGTANPRPFWVPPFLADEPRWLSQMRGVAGPGGLESLQKDSLRYALLMRKYQIEAFRREIPAGGYVVSVIRDFSTASMGLLDYAGKPKWTPTDWDWHNDTMCLLRTPNDCRTFFAGDKLQADVLISHFGSGRLVDGALAVSIRKDGNTRPIFRADKSGLRQDPGSVQDALTIAPVLPCVDRPTRFLVKATLATPSGVHANEWPIWIVPRAEPAKQPRVWLHASCTDAVNRALAPAALPLGAQDPPGVVIAQAFDERLFQLLERGGKVLFLPDGKRHSFPLDEHWFLRGAPYVSTHPLLNVIPRELFVETQAFDLASRVIPDVGYLKQVDPIVMLWDTHDIDRVKTHGLLFETRVGKGKLMVSALRHDGPANAVGRWLLDVLVNYLQTVSNPKNSMPLAVLRQEVDKIR